MSVILQMKLQRAMDLYNDLMYVLPEDCLTKTLPGLPSNEVGQQLWCVIGARNSYLMALEAGKWVGFKCPLHWSKTGSKADIDIAMKETYIDVLLFFEYNRKYSKSILIDLLEHEVQHHGQLIRYLYGLKLKIPGRWKKRYHLD